jgi:hypothetical protein
MLPCTGSASVTGFLPIQRLEVPGRTEARGLIGFFDRAT